MGSLAFEVVVVWDQNTPLLTPCSPLKPAAAAGPTPGIKFNASGASDPVIFVNPVSCLLRSTNELSMTSPKPTADNPRSPIPLTPCHIPFPILPKNLPIPPRNISSGGSIDLSFCLLVFLIVAISKISIYVHMGVLHSLVC
jgi:hypothetical protein